MQSSSTLLSVYGNRMTKSNVWRKRRRYCGVCDSSHLSILQTKLYFFLMSEPDFANHFFSNKMKKMHRIKSKNGIAYRQQMGRKLLNFGWTYDEQIIDWKNKLLVRLPLWMNRKCLWLSRVTQEMYYLSARMYMRKWLLHCNAVWLLLYACLCCCMNVFVGALASAKNFHCHTAPSAFILNDSSRYDCCFDNVREGNFLRTFWASFEI